MTTLPFPFNDILHGIEREPLSPAVGQLVCPVVFLWKQPGQTLKASAMSGALKHGETVEVTDAKVLNGRTWYHVNSPATDKRPAQSGWCLDSFLLEKGKRDENLPR